MQKALFGFGAALCAAIGPAAPPAAATDPPNVLFLMVDDLRPLIGAFGDPRVQTPNLDRLAARGLSFRNVHAQYAMCNPSRASLLTGKRPDTTGVYDLTSHFRTRLPSTVTLPQLFKENGYLTVGMGKIYHEQGIDDPPSWSLGGSWWPPEPFPGDGSSWMIIDAPDGETRDGKLANGAIQVLQRTVDGRLFGKPFFLAVGLRKPHLPFNAPRSYFDLYPPEEVGLPGNIFKPLNMPWLASANAAELREFTDIPPQGSIPLEKATELIRAHWACVSFVDAQVGRILAELERLGLVDKTIIVLTSDHGYLLDEHDDWAKQTNFDLNTRTPVIVSYPGQPNPGAATDALAELVDLYPTLAELAGLPAPADLEGQSLVPLFADPAAPFKERAFSQILRSSGYMGYSLQSGPYRYVEWWTFDEASGQRGDRLVAVELYDRAADADENESIAPYPENAALVAQLSAELAATWPGGF